MFSSYVVDDQFTVHSLVDDCDQFLLDKSDIKTEFEEVGDVEYIDEEVEYAVEEDMHNDIDEDTNDGYEDEDGILKPETEKGFSLDTMEHGEGRSFSCDLCSKVFGK